MKPQPHKAQILAQLVKAQILTRRAAKVVNTNIYAFDKLAKAHTPEQKKALIKLRFELLQIVFKPSDINRVTLSHPEPPAAGTPHHTAKREQSEPIKKG